MAVLPDECVVHILQFSGIDSSRRRHTSTYLDVDRKLFPFQTVVERESEKNP
jgi:hypothetical protein